MLKNISLLFTLLIATFASLPMQKSNGLSIKEKWATGLFTESKYDFEKQLVICSPQEKQYIGFDNTEKNIVSGKTRIVQDSQWLEKNKHLKIYDTETNELINPNDYAEKFQWQRYYYAYDQNGNRTIVGKMWNDCIEVFQETIQQIVNLTTKKESDLRNIKTWYRYNRLGGMFQVLKDQNDYRIMRMFDSEFSEDLGTHGLEYQLVFLKTPFYSLDLSIPQLSPWSQSHEEAILLGAIEHQETKKKNYTLIDVNNKTILYSFAEYSPEKEFFMSSAGDQIGYYDDKIKQLVIFKVLDDKSKPINRITTFSDVVFTLEN